MALVILTPPTVRRFVSSGWGAPRPHRPGSHEGLDFPGDVGSPVVAAADGLVVQVKNVDNSLAGKFVAIEHAGGVVSRYLHNKENLVTVGQVVTRGEAIATLGQTGTSGNGQPHVHFDLKLKDDAFLEYVERFGAPVPGYGNATGHGIGVPSEALMSGVSYRPQVKEQGILRGVRFHSASPFIGLLAAGIGVGLGLRYFVNRSKKRS